MLDQDILRTFVRIIETGSFTAAADQVGRTPSAVSMQIKRLEEATGRRLLVRSSHGVSATAEGEILLLHARQILEAHEAAFDAIMGVRAEESLSIGLPENYLSTILEPHVADFEHTFPNTSLHVICNASPSLLQQYSEGALDIALLTELQLGGDERGELIYQEEGVWACRKDSTAYKQSPIRLATSFEGSFYRRFAQEALRQKDKAYRITVAANRHHTIQIAVNTGATVGLLPKTWMLPSMRELTPEEGFPPIPPLRVRMRLSKRRMPAAGEWLAGRLRERAVEFLADNNN